MIKDRTYQRWTTKELSTLRELRRQEYDFPTIARHLGRNERSCYNCWSRERERAERRQPEPGKKRATPMAQVPLVQVDASALADRELRYTLAPRDLTAARFGDPLPGYSALDRR